MEILEKRADEDSPVLAEIEKDVSRTFPGNVFFGKIARAFTRRR